MRALYRAILCDAVTVLADGRRVPTPKRARDARDVIEWILRDDEEWPFSFRNVCAVLDLHPDRVRHQLRAQGLLS
jgi:hypothetical protein